MNTCEMKKRSFLCNVLIIAVASVMMFGLVSLMSAFSYADDAKIVAPAKNSTHMVGKEIQLKAKLDSYHENYNSLIHYIVFEVRHNDSQVLIREKTVFDTSTVDMGTFKPTEAGTYNLRVLCYTTNTWSAYYQGPETIDNPDQSYNIKVVRSAASIKKVKPKVVVYRDSKTSAEITMTNFQGDGALIYRATKKNGKFKLIRTTKKPVYTNKKLKSSKVYYYKVRYFAKKGSKKYYSKYSKVMKAGKYVKPKLPVASLSYTKAKGVHVKWKFTKKVDIFMVLRKEDRNSDAYDFIDEVKGTTFSLYDNKDLESGKTYYYCVVGVKNPYGDHPTKYWGKDKAIKIP